ncbi:MAG: type IV secretion system protein [Campylobacteraceae bacterium]|jgi:type IV secretion system protein VirB5|nr:type IV secretion system protein [Campylobacteraceae bacterium]
MRIIRHIFLSLSILFLSSNNSNAIGISVTDSGAIVTQWKGVLQQSKEYIQEAQRWVQTYQFYENQIKLFRDQFKALSDSDKFIVILNQLGMLANEMEHVGKLFSNIDDIMDNPELAMGNKSKAIRDQFSAYNSCAAYQNRTAEEDKAQKACTLLFNAEYMDITGTLELKKEIEKTAKNVNELIKLSYSIKDSGSVKTSQDLANMLSALEIDLQSKKDQLDSFTKNVQSMKAMAKNTIEQFKALASDTSVDLGTYGGGDEEEDE